MQQLRVVSVNVGEPRQVEWSGKTVATGIFKSPVAGPVELRQLNFEGDRQADLTVHGGPDKAVYVYPAEYYDFWRQKLPDPTLGWGMFGENLTTFGLLDDQVNIGDRFAIGTAELAVTQPRIPCYKLNLKFGRNDMVKLFTRQAHTGFYLTVLKEGQVEASDAITLLEADPNGVKVSDISRLYFQDRYDRETMQKAVGVPFLAQVWKEFFQEQLSKPVEA